MAFPVLVCLVDKKTRAPRSPKEQPLHAPTDVQEGTLQYISPWAVLRNALLLAFLKKQKQHALQIDHIRLLIVTYLYKICRIYMVNIREIKRVCNIPASWMIDVKLKVNYLSYRIRHTWWWFWSISADKR